MGENLDFSTQKSVNEMIERAREEREKTLCLVDFFLNTKVPSAFLNIKLTIGHLNEIITRLEGDSLIKEEDYMNLEQACIDTLNEIKEKLDNIKFTEEELLTTDVIGESNAMLENISKKLDVIPVRLLEKGKTFMLESITKKDETQKVKEELRTKLLEEEEKEKQEIEKKQRADEEKRKQQLKEKEDKKNKIKEEINELEKQKMYLQGKLDASIFGKKDLREQILELEAKIKEKTEELDLFNLDENDDDEQRQETENKEVEVNDVIKAENNEDKKVTQNLDTKEQEDETIEF